MIRRLAVALGAALALTAVGAVAPEDSPVAPEPAHAACYADASSTSKSFSTLQGSVTLSFLTYYEDCSVYVILKSVRVTISGPADSVYNTTLRYYSGSTAVLVASRSGRFYNGSTYSLSRIRCNDTCTGVYIGDIAVNWASDVHFVMSDALT